MMSALRSHAYQEHAWPDFPGKALNTPVMLPLLLGFPALVIALLIAAGGHMAAPQGNNAELASIYWGNMIELKTLPLDKSLPGASSGEKAA